MAKLPESRNPNLPRPAAPVVPAVPMRPVPGPPESPRGPSPVRALVAMVLIAGGFAAAIIFYIRGSHKAVAAEESLALTLQHLAEATWESGGVAEGMLPVDDEASKDLDDLPRIIGAVKDRARRERSYQKITVLDGDPPPGKGTATHQFRYDFNGATHLILRVRAERGGLIYFLGEANRVLPSRVAWEKGERTVPPEDALPPVVDREAMDRARKAAALPPGAPVIDPELEPDPSAIAPPPPPAPATTPPPPPE